MATENQGLTDISIYVIVMWRMEELRSFLCAKIVPAGRRLAWKNG